MKTLLLSISLAANGAMSYILVSHIRPLPEVLGPVARLSAAESGIDEAADATSLRSRLERLGLEDSLTKSIVYSVVVHTAEQALAPERSDYWQLDPFWKLDHALALADAHEESRTRLAEIYGEAASKEPAFRALYRPLGTRFDFLSAEQQVAVERVRLEFQRSRTAKQSRLRRYETNANPPGLNPSRVGSTSEDGHAALRDALAAVLDERALFEYELRESPLASELRASRIGLDEGEFRETYRILAELDRGEAGPDGFLAARRDLAALLGKSRFLALWASRDPRFAALARAGQSRGLREAAVWSAYEIVSDVQDEMLRAMGGAREDSVERAAAIHALRMEQQRRLTGLVGKDVALSLLGEIDRDSRARASNRPE